MSTLCNCIEIRDAVYIQITSHAAKEIKVHLITDNKQTPIAVEITGYETHTSTKWETKIVFKITRPDTSHDPVVNLHRNFKELLLKNGYKRSIEGNDVVFHLKHNEN